MDEELLTSIQCKIAKRLKKKKKNLFLLIRKIQNDDNSLINNVNIDGTRVIKKKV